MHNLSEQLKARALITQNPARMWKNRHSPAWLMGMQNSAATLKDSLAVTYKIKHIPTILSSSHVPWNLPKRVKTYPHKILHVDAVVGMFITAKTRKLPRCPLASKWVNKLVRPDNGI